ncbi:hypothetical protein [uncultured Methanobrevibacter sp.]|uniref:hypothetical protein n=1 Tax=uncultured Methanobrevibacter sp. TaxID=253161 RepID=UPI002614C2B9|nr:hypothetical protein [uncultured Methanobrevibacter sp.]
MVDTKIETGTDKYDLAEIRLGDEVIPCNSFKIGYKIKSERQTVTNSYTGVGWKLSEEEYTFEVSEVLPQYFDIINDRWKEQKKDKLSMSVTAYNYVEDGDYEEQCTLYGCIITDIDWEQESGVKFTVKGEALSKKDKN